MPRTTMRSVRGMSVALLLACVPALPAFAQDANYVEASASSFNSIEARALSLEPGDYIWEPDRAADGALQIVVSLPVQTVYVFRGSTLIGVSTTSTGRDGHETPVGRFPILQKREEHYSNLYNNAPMPFMQRLTWDGIALHGGALPGYPDSHGCIRLPQSFARSLFRATGLGTVVYVIDEVPAAADEALALAAEAHPA
jgi:hypothetical protein